jgi:hypothetical protein
MVKLSALDADRALPKKIPGSHLLEILLEFNPRVIVRLEGLGRKKKIQWPHRESNPRPSSM